MGKQMKVFNVSNIMNEVKLNSGELQPGTYQYTLYIDGQKVDSKQMLVAK